MTKFKVYRVNGYGNVTVVIIEAYDWVSLLGMVQYAGDPIFKIEVYSGQQPLDI